jgi:hypothetical protein
MDHSSALSILPRVKFWMPDSGLREIKGFLSLEDSRLVIDITDSLMGEWDKDHQVIKIEYDALREIGIDKGLFFDKLVIRPKSAQLLELIPGENPIEVNLRVWRRHRKKLERLLNDFWLSE